MVSKESDDDNQDVLDDAKEVMEQLGESVYLCFDAKHGKIPEEEQTKVLNLRGETEAEALGHSYHIRDMLRENGYTAECEYLGLADNQPDWSGEPRHKIELRINHE